MDRPVVLVTEQLAARPAVWLAERADVRRCAPAESAGDAAARDAAALIVRTYTDVNADLLRRMPALRVVARAGVGLDNVDVDACRAAGVEVVYTPEANTQAVVEYVFTLLLGAARPHPRIDHAVTGDIWRGMRAGAAANRQIDERVVGVLGLGRIGRRVAEVATAIGSRVRYHDLREIPVEGRGGAEPVTLEVLFGQSDVLSIHVDGRPGNRGLIGAESLSCLRPNAMLINTSRGFVVDKGALAGFLRSNPDARALLDVHDPEPIAEDDPLLALDNAMLYPHLAGRTDTGLENMSWVVRDVWAVLEGKPPRFPAGAAG